MKSGKNKGFVSFVGAGPGDAGLITLRGVKTLQTADVVIYDWLVNPSILDWCPDAEKIYVGKNLHKSLHEKRPAYTEQKRIDRLLVKYAKSGKKVVRLKGGDPFVFGRGGEEASFLNKNCIPFEIVPGVSAGIAAPTYAGIPVTDRRLSSSVTFVTGHTDRRKKKIPAKWKSLAELGGTIVSFMGLKNLPEITKSLLDSGLSHKTKVSVIEWGSLPWQRVVEGNLKTITTQVERAKIHSPALTVIGNVNALRQELRWFEKKPLFKKSVLITRAKTQASELKKSLEYQGARVLEYPAIRILPPENWKPMDQALQNLKSFDWVIFTSTNSVESFFSRLHHLGWDTRRFSTVKVAAVGKATQSALKAHGIQVDLVPDQFTSESLIKKMKARNAISHQRFLLPRTDIAPKYLKAALEENGAEVTQVIAYRTVASKADRKQLRQWVDQGQIDYVLFTSSSTVKHFFEALPRQKRVSRLISIGPVTSATIRDYGYKPYREAQEHTVQGLVEALIGDSYGK